MFDWLNVRISDERIEITYTLLIGNCVQEQKKKGWNQMICIPWALFFGSIAAKRNIVRFIIHLWEIILAIYEPGFVFLRFDAIPFICTSNEIGWN